MAEIQELSIPPEGLYNSFGELFSACQRHAKMAGYAFSNGSSNKRYGRCIKYINCKQYGDLPKKNSGAAGSRKRLRSSFKTDTAFPPSYNNLLIKINRMQGVTQGTRKT